MSRKYRILIAVLSFFILTMAYVLYPSSSGTRQFEDVRVSTFSKEFINVFLVSQGNKHLLIDAGLPNHKEDIEIFIKENGVDPKDLEAVIVTHAHHDHAGNAAYFQRQHGVKVIAGAGDLEAYEKGANGKLCPTSLMAKARHSMDQAGTFPAFTPDVLIDQVSDLRALAGIKGKINSIDAHTPGSLVIVVNDSAFVGDLVRGGIFIKNSAAMHFYQCDLDAVREGMSKILNEFAPNAKTFFPSHLGPVTRASVEKMLANLEPTRL